MLQHRYAHIHNGYLLQSLSMQSPTAKSSQLSFNFQLQLKQASLAAAHAEITEVRRQCQTHDQAYAALLHELDAAQDQCAHVRGENEELKQALYESGLQAQKASPVVTCPFLFCIFTVIHSY